MHSRPCKGLTIGCSELVAVGVYYVLDSDWGGIFLYVVVCIFAFFFVCVLCHTYFSHPYLGVLVLASADIQYINVHSMIL